MCSAYVYVLTQLVSISPLYSVAIWFLPPATPGIPGNNPNCTVVRFLYGCTEHELYGCTIFLKLFFFETWTRSSLSLSCWFDLIICEICISLGILQMLLSCTFVFSAGMFPSGVSVVFPAVDMPPKYTKETHCRACMRALGTRICSCHSKALTIHCD